MILQALVEYYERKDTATIPPPGWEQRTFKYSVVLSQDGDFIRFASLIEKDSKGKEHGKSFFVPSLGEKKGNGIKANLLWENAEYLFGIPVPTAGKPTPNIERVQAQNKAFQLRIRDLAERCRHPVVGSIVSFFNKIDAGRITSDPLWPMIAKEGPFLLLVVEGFPFPSDVAEIRRAILVPAEEGAKGICSVTGRTQEIARLEPAIKGVYGPDAKAERSLISFNKDAFNSFRKEQNKNAPIGRDTVSAYATALNILLDSNSSNRLQLGDTSTVFWAQKKDSQFEKPFRTFFDSKPSDDPDRGVADAKQSLMALISGIPPDENTSLFYILGLSPNAARISVRFWHQNTVGNFARCLSKHLNDLAISAPDFDTQRMGLRYLLCATVFDSKAENIPPSLVGSVTRAVLTDSPYPDMLLQQCLRRIRMEHFDNTNRGNYDHNGRTRAAILKACLNRKRIRSNPTNEKEITMSLDVTNDNPGYRLGRLFAVLEKIQEESSGGNLNASIRDRYYGAASSSPTTVFPRLLSLSSHHLSKLKADKPYAFVSSDKWLSEVFGGLGNEMPPHLAMDDQARFAIGYYHQRQAFFTKNETPKGAEE